MFRRKSKRRKTKRRKISSSPMTAKRALFFSQVSWLELGQISKGRAFGSVFQAQQWRCLALTASLEPGLGIWGHCTSRDANTATP